MPAPGRKKRTVSQLDREALGRISEELAYLSWPEQYGWMKDKYGLKLRESELEQLASPIINRVRDARSTLLRLLISAFERDVLDRFLTDLLEKTWLSGEAGQDMQERILQGEGSWSGMRRALQLLGYEWTKGQNMFGEEGIVILPVTEAGLREPETGRLRMLLLQKHPAVLNSLQSAYGSYLGGGADGNRQACEAARNALENLVRDFTHEDLRTGIDLVSAGNDKMARMLKALRDALSVWGTHAGTQPPEAEAYAAIRFTEESLAWILKTRDEW